MAFTDFGHYAYRAWAARDTFSTVSTGPWEAWYEIYTPDHQTLLFGPTKLSQQFATDEEAAEAAVKQAQREISHSIGGQTNPVR